MSTEQEITMYVAATWLDGVTDGLDPDVALLKLNIIDSTAMFDLVHHLQTRYRTVVPLEQVTPQNFGTIRDIAALVERLTTAGAAR